MISEIKAVSKITIAAVRLIFPTYSNISATSSPPCSIYRSENLRLQILTAMYRQLPAVSLSVRLLLFSAQFLKKAFQFLKFFLINLFSLIQCHYEIFQRIAIQLFQNIFSFQLLILFL